MILDGAMLTTSQDLILDGVQTFSTIVAQVGLPGLPYFPGAPVFRPLSPVSRTEAKISRI